jgi:hypothetical protein
MDEHAEAAFIEPLKLRIASCVQRLAVRDGASGK